MISFKRHPKSLILLMELMQASKASRRWNLCLVLSLALTFSFGEKVSKKNFAFVKSTFEEHRFDGSPNLCKHKFTVFRLPSGLSFSADVVGDDALHRPAVLTLPTIVGWCHKPSLLLLPTGGVHFLFAQKIDKKRALKSTYGSLDNHSLCRRIVSKALRKRTFEPLTLSTLEDAFHSLRQYLGCGFSFGYISRVLFDFLLYCSLANLF